MTKKNRPNLTVKLAQSEQDVQLAQALRAKCFGAEFGIEFADGLDVDVFDALCHHVLVFDTPTHEDGAKPKPVLVATTRLMTRSGAAKVGRFYSESEFDLTDIVNNFEGEILEVGRSCVDTDYRSMSAINALWQGIGDVSASTGAKALLGCASIPVASGDTQGWLDGLSSDKKIHVYPTKALPKPTTDKVPPLPPLLKAYLRMGSLVGDTACFDPSFKCADVLIWFPLTRMDKRYLARFGDKVQVDG